MMMTHGTLLILALLAPQEPTQESRSPRTGEFTDDLKDSKSGELIMRYRMWVPRKLPEKKHLGLIVAFHGTGGNQDSMTRRALEAVRREGLAGQYVVTGGCSKNRDRKKWEARVDWPYVLKWLDWAMKTYPIDPRRVHIVGFSNGGWAVRRFGWDHPELVASVTVFAGCANNVFGEKSFANPYQPGWRNGKASGRSTGDLKTEWYFIHGDKDDVVKVRESRMACEFLGPREYRYVYRELAGHNHVSVIKFAPVWNDAIRWMHALRHKEKAPAVDERKALVSMKKEIARIGSPRLRRRGREEKEPEAGPAVRSAPIIAECSRIGAQWGGDVLLKGLTSRLAEIREQAAASGERTLYGKAVVLQLIRLLKDRDASVRLAAIRGLGTAAHWRYAEAQGALCGLARSRSKPLDERLPAIQALAKPARFMLLGNFKDDPVILWTLVLLLEDREIDVRKAAFSALKTAVEGGFGYQPELEKTELRDSVRKWKEWCAQKCGAPTGSRRR